MPLADTIVKTISPTDRAPSIEVLCIEVNPSPGILARCDVQLDAVIIRRITVVNKGRGQFFNYPSKRIGDSWIRLVEIVSLPVRSAVEDAIKCALVEGIR